MSTPEQTPDPDASEVRVTDCPGSPGQALITLPFSRLDTQAWLLEIGVDRETLPLLRAAIDAYTPADEAAGPGCCDCDESFPDPCPGQANQTAGPDDTDVSEGEFDRAMAEGVPVEIATGPPPTYGAHRCGNCNGVDPDACLMNPGQVTDAASLRRAVYRILNVETEFVGCPSATTDRIMAVVQDRIDQQREQAEAEVRELRAERQDAVDLIPAESPSDRVRRILEQVKPGLSPRERLLVDDLMARTGASSQIYSEPAPGDTAVRKALIDALRAAAYDCRGQDQCGLTEQECADAHPVMVTAATNPVEWTTIDGPVGALADVALGVVQPRLDQAEAALGRVRKAVAERRTEVAEYEAENPPSAWSDAVTVTCARVEDALRPRPESQGIRALAGVAARQARGNETAPSGGTDTPKES